MPHIRIEPFDTSLLRDGIYGESRVVFKSKDLKDINELIAIELNGDRFLLHLKKSNKDWLLKSEKITRPLDVDLLKKSISDIAKGLNLKIISSNISIRESRAKVSNIYEKSIEDFENIEFSFKKVSIEVGFGSGKHILYRALNSPDELFIGIEIHTPSAQQLLRQIELKGLKNIWVINYDARLLLEMIPSNSIYKIFVHFPVPWDKKPHRRVISASFLDEAIRVLKKDGRLELRTDSYKYFWFSMNTFLGDNVLKTSLEIRKNNSLEVISKYEARWLKQKKDIYDIFVTSLDESKVRDLDLDFTFSNIVYRESILESISIKPMIFNDFFIHFERIYRIDKDSILLKLSFGNFNRPEHKYLKIDSRGCSYFNKKPVKTLTNYKTHLKIEEYLNV